MSKQVQSILFQLVWETSSQQEILAGFREYMRLKPRWTLRFNFYPDPLDVRGQDALVLAIPLPDARVKLPAFSGPILSIIECPRADISIERDNDAIGRMAARHLIDCGFRHLVYVPEKHPTANVTFSEKRWDGFRAEAALADIHAQKAPDTTRRWAPRSAIVRWLKKQPQPCGIFCANDFLAMEALSIARFLGIDVPQTWGLLGADNDRILCETAIPQLSSVSIPWRRVGYETAVSVDKLLKREGPPEQCLLIPPDRVACRQSTDLIASENPKLAKAIQFIRENACQGITVKEVVDHVTIDRRALYALFRGHLGKTPHAEIRRLQIEKARDLLLHTEANLREISRQVGLSEIYFINNFRKAIGMTPGAYRSLNRKGLWSQNHRNT